MLNGESLALIVDMKTLLVKLDIKPLTQNHKLIPVKRGKFARLIKNPAYKKYEDQLDAELAKYFDHFRVLGTGFDEKNHALEATWSVYIPETEFFTKKGTISKTCIDATNTVKTMEDRLVHILGVDDSQICSTLVKKIPTTASSWCVVLELSIVMRPLVADLGNERYLPVF